MGKNQNFNAKYVIEVNGKTTNGFMDKIIESTLKEVVQAINNHGKQINITITKEI